MHLFGADYGHETMNSRINPDRLMDDLRTLRTFGASGNGVVRPTFSPQDMAARQWLRDRMSEAGLNAAVDGVGNVFGRSPNPGPALILGSHSDTQPEGGWLDGAMGVIYGLEVARALLEDPNTSHLAIDAVAWSDEEGTYTSCLGSTGFVNGLTADDMEATNASGESVRNALRRTGLDGVAPARFQPDRHVAYLEAHIEQGPHLEANDQRIGVVTNIVGIRGVRVTFDGVQNHAGTTPMHLRNDAAVAMFHFGSRLQDRMAEAAGPLSVWTTGVVTVEPGAESIIPDRASITIQFRDPSDATLDRMSDAVMRLASESNGVKGVDVVATPRREKIAPTAMDPHLMHHIATAANARVPDHWCEMPSAAGHDPMVLSHHLPCAMLFIPSIGGISHDFAEDSAEEDIVLGAQVLADAAVSILEDLES